MRRSLKHGAGYLVIDHQDSPGISAAEIAHIPGMLAAPGGEILERDGKACWHCQRWVVFEPLRVRARGYCPKCDHYVCDTCEAIRVKTGECSPAVKQFDLAEEHLNKFVGREDHPDAQPKILLTDPF